MIKEAEKWGLFKDVFPAKTSPTVHMTIQYGKKTQLGAFGHPIQPEFVTY